MSNITIYIKIKSIAKRKSVVAGIPFIVDGDIATSDGLVEHIVRQMVREYNLGATDKSLLPYLTDDEIANRERAGKIGFDERKNENNQDEDGAVENALLCFSDGIFRMFVNEEEVFMGQDVKLCEGDEITFVRLTMLAGRLW